MSIVSDLIPVVDYARKIIESTGFRINVVKTILITWPEGKVGIPGVTPTTKIVQLDPLPKVLKYTTEEIIKAGGTITDVDLKVSKISKKYSLADLNGGILSKNQEFFWLVDNDYYRFIGYQERPIGWNVQIRRVNRHA